jgi:hypothetical protein
MLGIDFFFRKNLLRVLWGNISFYEVFMVYGPINVIFLYFVSTILETL